MGKPLEERQIIDMEGQRREVGLKIILERFEKLNW